MDSQSGFGETRGYGSDLLSRMHIAFAPHLVSDICAAVALHTARYPTHQANRSILWDRLASRTQKGPLLIDKQTVQDNGQLRDLVCDRVIESYPTI